MLTKFGTKVKEDGEELFGKGSRQFQRRGMPPWNGAQKKYKTVVCWQFDSILIEAFFGPGNRWDIFLNGKDVGYVMSGGRGKTGATSMWDPIAVMVEKVFNDQVTTEDMWQAAIDYNENP